MNLHTIIEFETTDNLDYFAIKRESKTNLSNVVAIYKVCNMGEKC